jgi:glutaredoxin 3
MQTNSLLDITVFSQDSCPGCASVKDLLRSKGLSFTELNVSADKSAKDLLQKKIPGARTVPQVIINNKVIGGLDMLRKYLTRS